MTRIHKRARATFFSPEGTKDRPVDLKDLSDERVTYFEYADGRKETWTDNWRQSENPKGPAPERFVGRTVFKLSSKPTGRKLVGKQTTLPEPTPLKPKPQPQPLEQEQKCPRNDHHVPAGNHASGISEGVEKPFGSLPRQHRGQGHSSATSMGGFSLPLAVPALVPSDAGPGADREIGNQVHGVHHPDHRRAAGDHHEGFHQDLQVVRPLKETYEMSWEKFLIEVQIRGPGDRVWALLPDLIGRAALHLLAGRLRREPHPFSGLA